MNSLKPWPLFSLKKKKEHKKRTYGNDRPWINFCYYYHFYFQFSNFSFVQKKIDYFFQIIIILVCIINIIEILVIFYNQKGRKIKQNGK